MPEKQTVMAIGAGNKPLAIDRLVWADPGMWAFPAAPHGDGMPYRRRWRDEGNGASNGTIDLGYLRAGAACICTGTAACRAPRSELVLWRGTQAERESTP